MELDEKIKLSKWADILSNHFQAYVNSKLKPYNLKFAEFIYLLNLYGHNGTYQDFIIKRRYTDKAATTRILQSLEKKGFITREKSNSDKRANCIYLTQKSFDCKENLYEIIDDWEELLNDCIHRDDYDKIANALKTLTIKILTKLGKN